MSSELSTLLRRYRTAAGLTQEGLAERANLSYEAVSALERGKRLYPRPHTIEQLSEALGLAPAQRDTLTAAGGRHPEVRTPAPQVSRITPRQLPAAVADFTGRSDQLTRVTDELLRPSSAGGGPVVLAVTGMGGVGKTSLALEAAHSVTAHYPDGQLYLNLQGFGTGAPVSALQALQHLITSLGGDSDRVGTDIAAAVGVYRSLIAKRRILVVIDNVADSDVVRLLLPTTPGAAVLITSRLVLVLPGAIQVELGELSSEDAIDLLRAVAGERIDAEAEQSRALATRCGHLPLALRLAAARLLARPNWPVAHLAERLMNEERLLDELESGHLGVRATLTFSIAQLAEDADDGGDEAVRLFALLGLLDGPDIGLEVAARLADRPEPQIEALLEHLVDLHLLTTSSPGRYELHDLVRLFARELAVSAFTAEERAQAVGRVINFYQSAAWHGMRLFDPDSSRLRWLDTEPVTFTIEFGDSNQAFTWIETELPNIIALYDGRARSHSPEALTSLCLGMSNFYLARGHWSDGVRTAEIALGFTQSPWVRASLLHDIGQGKWHSGRDGGGLADLLEAVEQFKGLGDTWAEAVGTTNIAVFHNRRGEYALARPYALRVVELGRQMNHPATISRGLDSVGMAEYYLDAKDEAYRCFAEAVRIAEESGNMRSGASPLSNLAAIHGMRGGLDKAVPMFHRVIAIYEGLGHLSGVAHGWLDLGEAYTESGDHRSAIDCYREAFAVAMIRADAVAEARVRRRLGESHLALGDFEDAKRHLAAAEAVYPYTDDQLSGEIARLLALALSRGPAGSAG